MTNKWYFSFLYLIFYEHIYWNLIYVCTTIHSKSKKVTNDAKIIYLFITVCFTYWSFFLVFPIKRIMDFFLIWRSFRERNPEWEYIIRMLTQLFIRFRWERGMYGFGILWFSWVYLIDQLHLRLDRLWDLKALVKVCR
jgi:hypothetical protein